MCPSTRAHWRHLAHAIELVHPSAHSSPQSKRQLDRFSRFCTAYGRKCLYFTMGATIHQNCLFPWKIWTFHVTRVAFGPSPFPQIDIIGAMVIVWRVRGKLSGLFCAILCATIVHSAMHTYINRPNSSLDWVLSHWAHFTVPRFIFSERGRSRSLFAVARPSVVCLSSFSERERVSSC